MGGIGSLQVYKNCPKTRLRCSLPHANIQMIQFGRFNLFFGSQLTFVQFNLAQVSTICGFDNFDELNQFGSAKGAKGERVSGGAIVGVHAKCGTFR